MMPEFKYVIIIGVNAKNNRINFLKHCLMNSGTFLRVIIIKTLIKAINKIYHF